MATRFILVTVVILSCVLSMVCAQYTYTIGPMDITQDVGDRNIFIPCPFGGPAAVTWMIGNRTYTHSTLPSPFISVSSGLVIQTIYQNMSGLSFQCFAPSGDALKTYPSSTGKLSVRQQSLTENVEQEACLPMQFVPKPVNFSQDSGDQYVFVPCPYGGPAAPSWKIGNRIYTSSTLPNIFIQVAGGLIIKSINNSMSGLSFQCFSPKGEGILVDKSSVGYLTVLDHTEKDEHTYESQDTASFSDYYFSRINLDHQKFLFTNESMTIAWKPIGQHCSYFVNSTTCITRGSESSQPKYYNVDIMDTKVAIDTTFLYADIRGKLMYFNIHIAYEENEVCPVSQIPSQIALKEHVVTETHSVTPYHEKVCFEVPAPSTSKGSVRFVMPNRRVNDLTGQGQDVICPAECNEEDIDQNCCSLENKCTPLLENTIFSELTTLCKKKNSSEIYQLCIKNLTEEMNNTKIHFYYERTCTSARTRGTIFVAEYVKADEIIVTTPPPPTNFSVNLDSGEICVTPQSDEPYPADYFTVNITDVTGYKIIMNEEIQSFTSCITVNFLLVLECAPFNISVVGHNIHGHSKLRSQLLGEGANESSWCDCANRKVQISLNSSTTNRVVNYIYYCHNKSSDKIQPTINFVIQLQTESGHIIHSNGPRSCTSQTISRFRSGKFDGLECSTKYTIAAYFVFLNESLTDYQLINTFKEISTTGSLRDLSCPNHFLEVLIPILFATIIVVTVTVISIACYQNKEKVCRKRQNMNLIHNKKEKI